MKKIVNVTDVVVVYRTELECKWTRAQNVAVLLSVLLIAFVFFFIASFLFLSIFWFRVQGLVRVRINISCILAIMTPSSSRKRQNTIVRNGIDGYKWHRQLRKGKLLRVYH